MRRPGPSRPARSRSGRACAIALACLVGGPALATGGSYATSGTGTFAPSLWWLNFAGFNVGSTSAQSLTFTLPNGAGTLSMAASVSSTGMQLVAEPSWSGGGAFGHGAYNGVSGTPIFYWLSQGGTGSTTLSSLSVKDAAGNSRSFALYAADGENTNGSESITYASTANWVLIDTVSYYANFNGNVPSLTGTGTPSVVESGNNGANYNASLVFGSANPTQVSATFSGNEAVLFALSLPQVTLNISIPQGRISASDQFTAAIAYATPAAAVTGITTGGAATSASTGASSVLGTNKITLSAAMASGSFSALSAYSGNISCTNSGVGAAAFGGTNTVLPSGAGTSFSLTPQTGDAISCTLTLTPPPQTLSGTVYADLNHDGNDDAGDAGTGVGGLYVKLASYVGGSCQSPALSATPVSSASGAYTVSGVVAGSYCLVLSNNNTLSSVTPALPSGWIGTQNPSGLIELSVAASSPPPPQNFGLYHGSSVSGTVFGDTGAGSGIANNGVPDGAEAGLAAVTVQMSGSVSTSGSTASNGGYTLWIPAAASAALTVTPTAPSGYLATGGSAGTTGGNYLRPSVTFTPTAGSTYGGVNFGLVPPLSFTPNGAQQSQPGTTLTYAHAFVAGSAGQVTFTLAGSSTPAAPAWIQTLYQDVACTGALTGSDPIVGAPLTVTQGQKVCLLVKVQIPGGSLSGAQSTASLSAAFAYTNASPALSATAAVTDLTTVGAPGSLTLTKLLSDVTQGTPTGNSVSAKPADTVQYTLTATNNGSQTISTLVIYDATPAFTTFVATSCPASLPSGVTGCSITAQPAAGASGSLQWTFTGSLSSGATLTVTYEVKVGS